MKYNVKCINCEAIYEVEHPMSESHPPCKKCGGKLGTYITTPPKFILKGDNWSSKEAREERDLNRAF